MRTTLTDIIMVYGMAALFLAGCEHEAVTTPSETRGRVLRFAGGIGTSARADVSAETTRADAGTVESGLAASRERLLKKTFVWEGEPRDVIRVCNVESPEALPDFRLEGGRTYRYVCLKHNDENGDPYPDTGSPEEDSHVGDTYSEYTFEPVDGEKGFRIGDLVDDGKDYFRLYAAWWREYSYFPEKDGPEGIAKDQSEEEGFLNSDLLLAFKTHNINEFEEPIRLKFHHSLSMLDVRVEVPVYDPGSRENGEETRPSGYKTGDVRMSMTNVPTGFTINTGTEKNSDVLVDVIADTKTVADEIPMFRYYMEDEDKEGDDAGHEGSDGTEEGPAPTVSRYRTYGFCGILPPALPGTGLPLLRLHLKDPLTGKDEAYVYIPDQDPGSGGLALSGEKISVLRLKLSRSMKRMLVLSARVEPWNKAAGTLDMMEDPAK